MTVQAEAVARTRTFAPNWLLVAVALGIFFAADDQTFVVTVLPSMIEGIGLHQDEFYRAAWIINGYILGYVVAMPLMAPLPVLFGYSDMLEEAALDLGQAASLVATSPN